MQPYLLFDPQRKQSPVFSQPKDQPIYSFPLTGQKEKHEQELAQERQKHQKEIKKTIAAAQRKERKHIAHELHDNVNQLMMVAKLTLEAMELPDEFNQQLQGRALGSLLKAIEEVRSLSSRLTGQPRKEHTLMEDINTLVDEISYTQAFSISFSYDNNNYELLSSSKKIALFRIIQEQMTNTIKYSKASKVKISLKLEDGIVHLCIKDNGIGFDLQQARVGVGLPGIYERARTFRGEAVVQSGQGRGCSLSVRIPFHDNNMAA
ncbi:MAG: hypothetical protein J7621_23815 [Niastella sp.]|nr:hypothetical protein [Niastella sp.]